MIITRINLDRNVIKNIDHLEIELNGKIYRFKERFGKLQINKVANDDSQEDAIAIYPGVSNQIDID